MRQMTLAQSGAPGCVIGWTNFLHKQNNTCSLSKFSIFYWICLLVILLISVGVELLLYLAVTVEFHI